MRKSCVSVVDSMWMSGHNYPQPLRQFHNMGKTRPVVRSFYGSHTHAFAQAGSANNGSAATVVHAFRRLNNKNNN
jgi:hypothetical protein